MKTGRGDFVSQDCGSDLRLFHLLDNDDENGGDDDDDDDNGDVDDDGEGDER